jgi:steroid 5-alpha reductase family enzyme
MGRAREGRSLAVGFAWIAVAYVAAGVAAALVWTRVLPHVATWERIAAADVAATVVVFAFSVLFDNSSFYDAYWSVAPMVIAPALAAQSGTDVPLARRAVVIALVLVWGARLTFNWARGWQGLAHEDWRYADYRGKRSPYWVTSLVGFHMMPTVWVYLGCLSLIPAIATGTRPVGPLDAAGFVVTTGAIAIEAVADEQLRAFRLGQPTPGRILDTGLWALSRHPNYFGELSFWWGLYLFALAADPSWWGAIAGALSITMLFMFLSVPLLDKRSLARRPQYRDHMRRVPALFPNPFGRRGDR